MVEVALHFGHSFHLALLGARRDHPLEFPFVCGAGKGGEYVPASSSPPRASWQSLPHVVALAPCAHDHVSLARPCLLLFF